MGQTARGLVFPDSGGHTRIWEHLESLANTADAAIGLAVMPGNLKIASGSATLNLSNAANGSVAVTFPAGRFTAAPITVGNAQGGGGTDYICSIGANPAPSATAVTIWLQQRAGTALTGARNIWWIAVGV
jgi:hypothetical protein